MKSEIKRLFMLLAVFLAVTATLTGCATKKYVKGETGAIHSRVDDVEDQVEEAQQRLDRHEDQIHAADQKAEGANTAASQASKTAHEALERAKEAGKLAEGKLLYETVLSDDKVKFGLNRSSLSDEARAALDEFANQLKAENRGVYIEIQGHTDSSGAEEYNYQLGLDRAEAVKRYLNQQHDIPLHRMSVISYGESEPVADNSTRDGRAQNRRVNLVVLQ